MKAVKIIRIIAIVPILCVVLLFMLGLFLSIGTEHGVTKDNALFWTIAVFIIIGLAFWFLRRVILNKLKRKPKQQTAPLEKVKEPVDLKKESMRMLSRAKKEFKKANYMEAYGLVAYAVRFYYSHNLAQGEELTNNSTARLLEEKGLEAKQAKKCFQIATLVEFARYKPNKKDFDEAYEIAKGLVK